MKIEAAAALLAFMALLGACAGHQEERALLPEECIVQAGSDPCFSEEYHRGM